MADSQGTGPSLRHLVLTGAPKGPDSIEAWGEFLVAKPDDAILAWFGSDTVRASTLASLSNAIDRDILAMDRLIAAQLDAILHHPRVQALESTWRGLHWLVNSIEDGPGDRIVIRVLDASWRDLARDVERAPEFDQSHVFHQVYEAEFGMAGGEPFGLLVVDHAVRHQPDEHSPADDRAVLEHLAQIAAAAFAPLVVGAAPELLGVDSFAELATTARPAAVLADAAHQRWRGLADRADSRFLAVALPRLLARPPWADDGTRDDGFRYREVAATARDRVWMNAGYAFAAVVARATARYSWPADVRGADPDRVGGGLLTGLPAEPHRLSQTLPLPRLPIEVVFDGSQERQLIEAGLMPLGTLPHGDTILFGAVRSLYHPPRLAGQAGAAAFANSRVATQMNAILCASRFAHHLKILGRSTIGRLRRADEVEAQLRTWLTGYVNRNTMASPETRAARPLYDASVRVSERAGKPGTFDCAMSLQPYFQLDNVTASFMFETELAPPNP